MARDLYDRLKQLKNAQDAERRASGAEGQAAGGVRRPSRPDRRLTGVQEVPFRGLAGWTEVAPLVRVRETTLPVPVPARETVNSRLLGREVSLGQLQFLDTETTGLSGGAGTTVFLTGTGRCDAGSLTVRQTLLLDFPGEREYLTALHGSLFDGGLWVSYNGRAFDSRLLETRYLMNGMAVRIPEQLDLLFWARRLWRRLIGPCSLEDIERRILGIERGADIPGQEIPERYFEFLRSGNASVLQAVFDHHMQDIVSLTRLFFLLEEILSDAAGMSSAMGRGTVPGPVPQYDRLALGRYLLTRGEGGEGLLRRVVDSPTRAEPPDVQEAAGLLLAASLRRAHAYSEAQRVWITLRDAGSIRAGVELAKQLEHRERNLVDAEALVAALLDQAGEGLLKQELRHRFNRIRRKRGV